MSEQEIVVITAGISEGSQTTSLASQAVKHLQELLEQQGIRAHFSTVQIKDLAGDIAQAAVTGRTSDRLQSRLDQIRGAAGVIAATPVYKASFAGLFKSFLDLLDDDALVATPLLLLGTGGTPRHSLVLDHDLRALFSYFRPLTVPTAVYAATEDWAQPKALADRLRRAGREFSVLLRADLKSQIFRRGEDQGYRITYVGGPVDEDLSLEDELDFDSELMRLAAGGKDQ